MATNSLFSISSSTKSSLSNVVAEEKLIAREEINSRRTFQTPESLERTFSGLTQYLDQIIVAKFISAGVIDESMYLTETGEGTNNEDDGVENNPNYMKVIVDGRKAWRSVELINKEMSQITDEIWSTKTHSGSLILLGFNDNSNEALHPNKQFTITEAGALAKLLFGTKENRATGLFFRNFIVRDITNAHEIYMKSDLCKRRAERAIARRSEVEQTTNGFEQYQSVSEQSTSVVCDKITVDKNGRRRLNGKFVGKNNPA